MRSQVPAAHPGRQNFLLPARRIESIQVCNIARAACRDTRRRAREAPVQIRQTTVRKSTRCFTPDNYRKQVVSRAANRSSYRVSSDANVCTSPCAPHDSSYAWRHEPFRHGRVLWLRVSPSSCRIDTLRVIPFGPAACGRRRSSAPARCAMPCARLFFRRRFFSYHTNEYQYAAKAHETPHQAPPPQACSFRHRQHRTGCRHGMRGAVARRMWRRRRR